MGNGTRSYKEICNELQTITKPKDFRRIHRELKRYGGGVPFVDRYPYIPLIISAIALIISYIKR